MRRQNFIVLLLFPLASCVQECPPNQQYTDCGSTCPDTCENINEPNRMCTMMCVQGCVCKKGLVKDKAGNCMRPEQCPGSASSTSQPTTSKQSSCGQNEEYNTCGTACPKTCKNRNPQMCTEQCVSDCFCKAGLVRDNNGKCIDPSQCPASDVTSTPNPTTSKPHPTTSKPKCGRNADYVRCPQPCPPTCQNPRGSPGCKMACKPYGCQCRKGFVKNANGACVRPQQCSKGQNDNRCGQNEEWSNGDCVAPPFCQPRCPLLPQVMCKVACGVLPGGCVCKSGCVRDGNSKCVPAGQCQGVNVSLAAKVNA